MNSIFEDLTAFFKAFGWYSKRKTVFLANNFESLKNLLVDIFMIRRGVLQKHVWHGSMVTLAAVAVLTSGVLGGQSLVSSAYPGIGGPDPRFVDTYEPFPAGPVLTESQDTHTLVSSKPRSDIVDYKVQSGDTISTIAEKFGISQDTIKWANDITNVNSIRPGDTIKILPVTGVSVTVKSGDTVQSLAKKYQTDAQAIVDFPFNDIPDDFTLEAGQSLIIPDGTPPEIAAPKPKPQPQFLAQGTSSPTFTAEGGANFIWPTNGIITQYFSWYHPGIDIANNQAPAIAAADGGIVAYSGWDTTGYGNRVDISHGNGYMTRYGHLSNIYVTIGQTVSRGQVIGQMGTTGRSTGIHLHFEVHHGVAINPLSILK